MRKLSSLKEALSYLQEGELLLFSDDRQWLRCYLKDAQNVRINGEQAAYTLSLADFQALFYDTVYYLYEPKEAPIEISKEKDEEYYGWYHK